MISFEFSCIEKSTSCRRRTVFLLLLCRHEEVHQVENVLVHGLPCQQNRKYCLPGWQVQPKNEMKICFLSRSGFIPITYRSTGCSRGVARMSCYRGSCAYTHKKLRSCVLKIDVKAKIAFVTFTMFHFKAHFDLNFYSNTS